MGHYATAGRSRRGMGAWARRHRAPVRPQPAVPRRDRVVGDGRRAAGPAGHARGARHVRASRPRSPGFLEHTSSFASSPIAAAATSSQVTSRESVAEPFVTLLVEATWPRGRNAARIHRPARSAGAVAGAGRSAAGAARGNALVGQQRARRPDQPPAPRRRPRRRRAPAPAPRRREPAPNVSERAPPSAPRAPGVRRRAASMVPCNAPRRSGRSPIACAPTASRSIK